MMTTSPERRRMGIGSSLGVARVPANKVENSASETGIRMMICPEKKEMKSTYDIQTSGEVAQASERSTWAIKVSYSQFESPAYP